MVQGLSILNPIPLRVWGIFLGDNMNKDYITKVSDIVGTDCKRPDLVGKSIVIYDNDKKHCYNRHYKDFDGKMKNYTKEYLKSKYALWNEDMLVYKKNQ